MIKTVVDQYGSLQPVSPDTPEVFLRLVPHRPMAALRAHGGLAVEMAYFIFFHLFSHYGLN